MDSPNIHEEDRTCPTAPESDVSLHSASVADASPTQELRPLFTAEEREQWKKRFSEWDKANRAGKTTWGDREAIEREVHHETRKRVEERAEEFTDGLLTIVGSRGRECMHFDAAFSLSGTPEAIALVAKHDTPENRRDLHTILKALEVVPRQWAMSAFVRFLRNQGEQAKPKYGYPGKGMFGKEYGWTGDDITAVCKGIMGGDHYSSYSTVLVTYPDVAKEIGEDDPDYEKRGSYQGTFAAVRAERNKKLIGLVCDILEKRGLEPAPAPQVKEPKPPRKAKEFKPGDIIRESTLRDLPLPALVRVPIEKRSMNLPKSTPWKEGWEKAELEWVVTELRMGSGEFVCFRAEPQTGEETERVAYSSGRYAGERRALLFGATYLGPWTGTLDKKNEMKYNFHYRRPGSDY